MKKQLIALLLIISACNLLAKNKIIVNPSFEVTTSGIYNITKIEIKRNETRLHVHCTFLPKWWIKFSKKIFIRDSNTDQKLYPTAILGGEFEKEIYMPASGDSTFILVFPKLNKTVTHIDYGEDDKTIIFRLSLDPKNRKVQTVAAIPSTIQQWIDAELVKAKIKKLVDYKSPDFFSRDTARVIGYIKGYDRRLGFSTGMIHASNELTNEDFPVVVNIREDGRFEASIPMNYPKYTYVSFKNEYVRFYIEPGQTLSIILSWDEFLTADRLRNISYRFNDVQFNGPSAQINKELLAVIPNKPDYKNLQTNVQKQFPADFKAGQMASWKESEERIEQDLQDKNFSEQTKTILRNEIIISNAAYFFDYIMKRNYAARTDTTGNQVVKAPVDSTYYDFLHKVPLNDQTILISSNFSTFINRFEYSNPFFNATRNISPQVRKPFNQYLFIELGLQPSAKDLEYFEFKDDLNKRLNKGMDITEQDSLLKELNKKAEEFFKKYSKYTDQYNKKYPEDSQNFQTAMALRVWNAKDSVLENYYKLQPNVVQEIAKVRSLKFLFNKLMIGKKDDSRTFLTSLEKGITNSFLMQESEIMFQKSYPGVPKAAYDLPEGEGADIFRKIIDQHKGKMLFVDFWATTCGPCISSIKHNKLTRAKYKEDKDFDFIFITSENESPLPRYNEFIKEQELAKTYRLSSDDFRHLRQLFKFNGIPRYVLINKEGKVLNDDFPMHNLEHELKKLVALN